MMKMSVFLEMEKKIGVKTFDSKLNFYTGIWSMLDVETLNTVEY